MQPSVILLAPLLVTRLLVSRLLLTLGPTRDERGDVPGWVLVTVTSGP